MKKIILILLGILVLAAGGYLVYKNLNKDDKQTNQTQTNQQTQQPTSEGSIENPSAIDVVVNKKRALSSTYEPTNLKDFSDGVRMRQETLEPLNNLMLAAKDQGISYYVASGYRSYEDQEKIYNDNVETDSKEAADTYSARPGHSEHQTGLALDLATSTCDLEQCFGDTPAGKWLEEHAHEYGFILRYKKGWESRTGYQYEPWHLRYVGKDLAEKLTKNMQTMEEYFNLPAAPTY